MKIGVCFVCKLKTEVKGIGMKKLGCKEVHLCASCDRKTSNIKSHNFSNFIVIPKKDSVKVVFVTKEGEKS